MVVGEFFTYTRCVSIQYHHGSNAGLSVIFGALYMLRAYQYMMHSNTNTLTETFGEISLNEKKYYWVVSSISYFLWAVSKYNFTNCRAVKQLIDHVQNSIIMAKHL